jgi:hypothetical protein
MKSRFRRTAVISGFIAAILMIASAILAAYCPDMGVQRQRLGYLVVGIWVIVPPIWFWIEWTFLSFGMGRDQIEDLKHSQDVSRNIWVAAVVVLAALFGIQWPGP